MASIYRQTKLVFHILWLFPQLSLSCVLQSLEKLSQVSLHDPDEDDSDCNISENAPGVEAQLLITLSNCAFMRRTILPRLSDSLVRASYPPEAVSFWGFQFCLPSNCDLIEYYRYVCICVYGYRFESNEFLNDYLVHMFHSIINWFFFVILLYMWLNLHLFYHQKGERSCRAS